MALKTESDAHILTVFLEGEIDHHIAKSIREEIDMSIERVHPATLALDFGEVTFMDSSGIGLVMGRYREMKQLNGSVTVKNAPASIRKVMRLAGLDKLAHIE
ncbi:MAG TPA: anti-anti-sigma factor [Ruminococcaceae bacterium]|nr:anti-anti-sigma factor [Oscillospiraceae bacterium]